MDLDGQIQLGHLLLQDRKCRVCREIKNLVDGFIELEKTEEQLLPHIHMNVKSVVRKE